jgi:hypothetical protein
MGTWQKAVIARLIKLLLPKSGTTGASPSSPPAKRILLRILLLLIFVIQGLKLRASHLLGGGVFLK